MSNHPRLLALNYGGMPVEINGVQIPVESWDIQYRDFGGADVTLRFAARFVPPEPEQSSADAEPEPSRAPQLAEAVHYVSHSTPGGEYGRECRAAIVTAVDAEDDTYASLCVLNPTGQFFNPKVSRGEGRVLWAGSNVCGYRGGTWHFADGCQGAEDAPDAVCSGRMTINEFRAGEGIPPLDADACAAAPGAGECTPAPVVHLTLSGLGGTAVHDVDALVRKFAKKADAAGLNLSVV